MDSTPALKPRHTHIHIPKEVPRVGDTLALFVTLTSITLLSVFIYKKVTRIQSWEKLPFASWLVLIIYADSYLSVISSSLLEQVFGVSTNQAPCQAAVLICLISYVLTKILIYVFLVEKAHAVQSSRMRRRDSKLYLFNIITLLVGYFIVAVMNFYYRFARLADGTCYIGMERISMIPLIAFDFIINIYLTILFLLPLTNLYSFKKQPQASANNRLRTVAWRTFIGACCTITSSVVNLIVIMVLVGEPGWICFMCCNVDVLFSAIVIQWVTSGEGGGGSSQSPSPSDEANSYGRSVSHQISTGRSPNNGNHDYNIDDEIGLATCHNVSSGIAKAHATGGVLVTAMTASNTRSTTDSKQSADDSRFGLPSSNSLYAPGGTEVPRLQQTHTRGGKGL